MQGRQAVPSGESHENLRGQSRGPGLDSSSSERLCALFWAQKAQVYMRGRDRQGVARHWGQGIWVKAVMPSEKAGVMGPA